MDNTFTRTRMIAARNSPTENRDWKTLIYQNLFSSWQNALLSVLALYIIYLIVPPLIRFALVDAVWSGTSGADCRVDNAGACWAFIQAKYDQYIYGRYPADERWRVDLVFWAGLAGLVPMMIPKLPYKGWNALYLLAIFPLLAFILLVGGVLGLEYVPTSDWGGLLVTMVVALTGMVFSLPLGVLLALGRRSELPFIRYSAIGFIEFWRGVPLITVLFMASLMLPLFLPAGAEPDNLVRAIVGVALFTSAYIAEAIRGGLQAVPSGQTEAGKALGLSYLANMRFIVLPQALRMSIPGIVNSYISLFKDTTLVLIIGLFDLLGMVHLSLSDAKWFAPNLSHTGYAFAALLFWGVCFAMSRYAAWMEKRLHVGHH